ncbi:MAG: MFS transporter [Acidobacteria bacterium]|nr:MFS transporter [Acidobacteriota bacterium]
MPASPAAPGRHYRWWIVSLLFLSTVINYIDRQTLSVLAPLIKTEQGWNNQDFGLIVISFRIAYTIGQSLSGRMVDRLGTRRGLSLAVAWYSIVAMATPLATGLRGFCAFRFLLGLGESANWPAATKAVSEWFPKRERALAVGIFDSGSSIGAALAPAIVLGITAWSGNWRWAFVVTGSLGFLWLWAWRRYAVGPVRVDDAEPSTPGSPATPRTPWRKLLTYPQTWGAIAARALCDPVWFFITDWFAIYLTSKGFKLEESLLAFWVPFLCADLGNYAGGGLSSYFVHRGWSVEWARKAVFVPGGLGMALLIPAAYTNDLLVITTCFGVATFCYAAGSTIANTLPADLFESTSVASVSGLSGTAAGLGTILSTYIIGYVADHYGFQSIVIAASTIPLLSVALVLALVRNSAVSGKGTVVRV